MTRNDEGVALVLALCLVLVASVVGASLMLLSQTETYASLNYRTMTQARYAAEAGVHGAVNYLLNTAGSASLYQPPATDADYAAFDTTKSPVQWNGAPVVLSSNPAVGSNYPVPGTVTGFNSAVAGNLGIGGPTVGYNATATMMSMTRFYDYASGVQKVIQTWSVTADGTTAGARPATVEVSATLEQQKVAFNMYAFFATNNQCGALSFSGGESTDSFDSSQLGNASAWTGGAVGVGVPVTVANNGNVGTNGNLTEGGTGTVVNGTLSTPRTGVGKCSDGAVDALTQNGKPQMNCGDPSCLVQLPQAVSYETPALPNPLPATGSVSLNTCPPGMATCGPCSPTPCSGIAITPIGGAHVLLGDVKLTAGSTLHLKAGIYDINSISLAGNSSVVIDSGPVVFNVVGSGANNPVDFSGGTETNMTYVPENFQIIYGGTGGVNVAGGAAAALMVYAPNAGVKLTGGGAVYGAVLGSTITDTGGTSVHYDRHLPSEFATAWNTMLSSFSWKKQ